MHDFVWCAVRSGRRTDYGMPLFKIEPLPPAYRMTSDTAFYSRELHEVQQWVAAENARLTEKRGGKKLVTIKTA